MNRLLSGTGWGEKVNIESQKADIQIAPWLRHEYRELNRKIYVAEEALIAAGRAQERRKERKLRQYRINQLKGLCVTLGIFVFLALVENFV